MCHADSVSNDHQLYNIMISPITHSHETTDQNTNAELSVARHQHQACAIVDFTV